MSISFSLYYVYQFVQSNCLSIFLRSLPAVKWMLEDCLQWPTTSARIESQKYKEEKRTNDWLHRYLIQDLDVWAVKIDKIGSEVDQINN